MSFEDEQRHNLDTLISRLREKVAEPRERGKQGTQVTAVDLETGDYETHKIVDDYIVVTDGRCYVDNINLYANGTATVTIKQRKDES